MICRPRGRHIEGIGAQPTLLEISPHYPNDRWTSSGDLMSFAPADGICVLRNASGRFLAPH